jgi:hypothetical protein
MILFVVVVVVGKTAGKAKRIASTFSMAGVAMTY